jgi:SAM-dependent methyltransferase
MKMLDIGVGAGRTTMYFAPLTKRYIGVDYSEKMIEICQQKYQGSPKKLSFEVADARSLKSFESNYFDLVLFSFNGIDYMSHQDRLTALREISRVTKNGGFFCFSTHNLNIAFKLCTFRLSKNPVKLFMEARRLILMRLINKKSWKALRKRVGRQKYMIFNDGAHNFRLKTYYVTPTEQIKQLTELNFSGIKIYGLLDGREIKNDYNLTGLMDGWVYYLATTSKHTQKSNPSG